MGGLAWEKGEKFLGGFGRGEMGTGKEDGSELGEKGVALRETGVALGQKAVATGARRGWHLEQKGLQLYVGEKG